MSDNNREKIASMTIGDALRKIEAGGEESLALLRMIEGNTKPATVGKAVKNAMPQQARKSIVPAATSKPTVITQAAISRSREASGRFVSAKPNEKIQPTQDQGKTLAEILKGGASKTWQEKKGDVKDIAGRAALGPMWDVGVQIKEAFQATKEKSNQGTAGELRAWGVSKFGKKPGADKDSKAQAAHTKAQAKHDKSEAESDKAEAKHDQHQAKADKAKATVKAGAAGTTVVNNGGGAGGGILSDIAGSWMGSKLGGVAGKVVSKVPLLGKLFPSLAVGGAAPAVAGAGGGMLAKAGGLISKVPGAGLLGKVGGRIPLIGGAITAATTLATGGSKSEAAGAGIGAVAGGALGTIAGPLGTIAGSIAGAWIGEKMGGLFNDQNKAQDALLSKQENQQAGFFSQLTTGISSLGAGIKETASTGYQAYKQSRESGGGFFGSLGAAVGAVAQRFESGKGGAGTVSTGAGDHGGKSYGSFQLSSKQGSVDKFLNKSGYSEQFKGLQVGTPEFDKKWKETAKTDPKFGDAQLNFAKEKYAAPQLAKLQAMGVDTSNRAIQEMAMSTGVQYGEGTDVLSSALKGKNAAKMSPADIVNAVQDYKASSVGSRFKSSSASVQQGVASRHNGAERQALLSLTGETVSPQTDNALKTKGKRPQIIQAASTSAPPQESKTAITQGVPEYKLPPEPKSIQPEPPPNIEKLMAAAAQQQSQTAQQASQNSNSDKGPAAALPHIPTEFSDVQLTLMAYDRT